MFGPVLKLILILVTFMMNYFLPSTVGPEPYWTEKGVSTCKGSDVHRKVIDKAVTLSPVGSRREIINDMGT